MNRSRKTLVAALTAAVLALGSAGAFADPRGEAGRGRDDGRGAGHGHRDGAQGHRHGPRGDRHGPQEHRGGSRAYRDAERIDRGGPGHGPRQWQGHDHRHVAPVVRYGQPWHAHGHARGAGPWHQLHVGTRLPAYYRGTHYVVHDWRAHRLAPPPYGYYWMQAGADYVLIAVGTGLIAQIVLGW